MTIATTEGEVRMELYAYLETQGLKITDSIHNEVKKYVMEHTRIQNERLAKDRINAMNSLFNIKTMPKHATLLKRLEDFQCPVCGRDFKKRSEYEYISQCPHLQDLMFALA